MQRQGEERPSYTIPRGSSNCLDLCIPSFLLFARQKSGHCESMGLHMQDAINWKKVNRSVIVIHRRDSNYTLYDLAQ